MLRMMIEKRYTCFKLECYKKFSQVQNKTQMHKIQQNYATKYITLVAVFSL